MNFSAQDMTTAASDGYRTAIEQAAQLAEQTNPQLAEQIRQLALPKA